MTEDRESRTINPGAAARPDREESDREVAGPSGDVRRKGEDPSPDDPDRGEIFAADRDSAIDVDAARDRAS